MPLGLYVEGHEVLGLLRLLRRLSHKHQIRRILRGAYLNSLVF